MAGSNGEFDFGVIVIALDTENNILTKTAEKVFEYTIGEKSLEYTWEWDSETEQYTYKLTHAGDNPRFNPTDGMIKEEINPWNLIQAKGVDPNTVTKWLIDFYSLEVHLVRTFEYDDSTLVVPPTFMRFGIDGLEFGLDVSDTQEQDMDDVQPYMSGGGTTGGNTTSTGGNITDIKYRTDRGEWQDATPADGAFDSPNEAFSIEISTMLADGEHIVEIKSLNEVGEKDAVYSSARFTIDTTPPSAITDLVAEIIPETTDVNLTWTKATDITSGVKEYRVYRATSMIEPSKLGDYIAVIPSETVVYTDTTTAEGNTYYYAVLSEDLAGNA